MLTSGHTAHTDNGGTMSDSTIHTALLAFHEGMKNPAKDGKGNYGAYLTLDGLLDHVRKPLADHGLYVTQNTATTDGLIAVWTTVRHSSGEVIEFGPLAGPLPGDWQKIGSAITYARRYALAAALGLSGGEDDDAQAPTNEARAKAPAKRGKAAAAEAPPVYTPEQVEQAELLIDTIDGIGSEDVLRDLFKENTALLDVPTGRGVTLRKAIVDAVDVMRAVAAVGEDGEAAE